ncbi:hypothetical protein LL038_09095 [Clostridium estertheticum]|uniref:Uncharacterized protein n=1 Tax=Clostridium estertheticum TaxID=238834 RepID=A0AA47EPI0_9CLOT|nr:hypothetical protein [Clostridium estertheticum]MBU3155813.1 hypothetical protein [Clostridium estertheticum]WAG62373.1 hypothetical protein LL038_09095 [Clostridium estertheticum]
MPIKKYPNIELSKSFLAGDSMCDVELGHNLGITTFGINVKSQILNYTCIRSLLEIVKYT